MDTWKSEELIKEFYRAMSASGMSSQIAARHRDKLRFFLHAYVAEEWPRDIDRIDSDIVRDFLGAWFLRHVGGSKSDITTWLGTFRRFYEYLYQTGRISEAEYDDLFMACSNRDYFMARYDDYLRPVPEAWEQYIACGIGEDGRAEIARGFGSSGIDYQLWILTHNLERPLTPAVLDFSLFLDYMAHMPVKLTKANSRLPRRHVSRINQRFSLPEDLPPRTGMESCRRVNWFFHLARILDLVRTNGKNALELTPLAEAFLDLESDVQLTIILDATWNRISWAELGASDSRRVSKWAQEHRDGFAALLADLSPNREWVLDPDPGIDRQDALLARYIIFHEVVENSILFTLRETGVLDYDSEESDADLPLKVNSITMTRFGRQVMRLLTRRAADQGKARQSPLARLQECLFL